MLGYAFSKKEGLCAKLALLNERFTESEKALAQEGNQKAAVQRTLGEAKMWRAGEDKRMEAAVARARKDALKKTKQ